MKKFLIMLLTCCIIVSFAACSQPTTEDVNTSDEDMYYTQEAETEEVAEEIEVIPEELPDPVEINADFEVITNADGTFVIETNLPDETELSLMLKGRGYLAQGKAFVEGGTAISERFTDGGDQLIGDFTLEVLMPIPNVQSDYVRHFIGKNGEYLTGPYVKGAMGSVVVSKTFKVSFNKKTETNDISTQETTKNTSVEYSEYYRTPNGKRYHLDPECAGESSYKSSDLDGLTPCQKCTQ